MNGHLRRLQAYGLPVTGFKNRFQWRWLYHMFLMARCWVLIFWVWRSPHGIIFCDTRFRHISRSWLDFRSAIWTFIRHLILRFFRCLNLKSQIPRQLAHGQNQLISCFRSTCFFLFENTHYRLVFARFRKRAWTQYVMISFVRCGWPQAYIVYSVPMAEDNSEKTCNQGTIVTGFNYHSGCTKKDICICLIGVS